MKPEHIPKVSVGLPVHNGENYLRQALESIVQQDYTDFELIISDNASTDATPEICREFTAKDPRIRYYRNETNIGASGNINRVVALARGQFFKWAFHDDIHLPGFLRRCVEVFDEAPPSVVLVAPRAEVIDANGKCLHWPVERLHAAHRRPHQRIAEVIRNVHYATAQFGLTRADVMRKTRLSAGFYGTDYVFLVELALMGEFREVPEVLFQTRFYQGVSTQLYKSPEELAAWFDPSKKFRRSFLPPVVRLGVEYLRSVSRVRLPVVERLLCYATVVRVWGARECRRLAVKYQYKIAIRTRLRNFFRMGTLSR